MRRTVLIGGCALSVLTGWPSAQGLPPAKPVEAVAAVLEALGTHRLVALTGTHGGEREQEFLIRLVRDPRFAAAVNDIVVEFGAGQSQPIIDRFLQGDPVPDRELRHVWQDTAVPDTTWDVPIIERFYRAVGEVNASLPAERKIRVLLGDPPIDWSAIRSVEDFLKVGVDRDTHPAEMIRREVLDRERRALIVYGDGHFWRNMPDNLVPRVERAANVRVFSIMIPAFVEVARLQPDIASWPTPSFASLWGTALGALDWSYYYPLPPAGTPGFPGATRIEDLMDALVYLGPRSTGTQSSLAPTLCSDQEFMSMRTARLALIGGGLPGPDRVTQLKDYCAQTVAH